MGRDGRPCLLREGKISYDAPLSRVVPFRDDAEAVDVAVMNYPTGSGHGEHPSQRTLIRYIVSDDNGVQGCRWHVPCHRAQVSCSAEADAEAVSETTDQELSKCSVWVAPQGLLPH